MAPLRVYNSKYNNLIGAVAFLVLIALALLYYKERVGISDTAYHLFTLLKNGDFAIQNKRFVAVFTQLFPLIGGKLLLPLSSVAMLYSAAFVIVQCIIFYTINNVLKNPRIALGYLLYLTLMTAHTFFWVQSELPQGVGFMFLYFALFDKIKEANRVRFFHGVILFLLLTTVAYSHPLLLFPFVFFHLFFISKSKQLNVILIGGILLYVLMAGTRTLLFKATYETTAFEGLKNFKYLFPNYFTIQSNKNFIHYIFSDYYFLIILFITNSLYYLRNKKIFKLFLSVAFFGSFLLLVNVCYHGGGNQFYFENQYLLLSIFVIIPFLYDVGPWIYEQRSLIFRTLPVLVAAVCFIRIALTKPYYTGMLNWKRAAIVKMSNTKDKRVIINIDQIPKTAILDTWSNPYEFWFLSTLEYGYSQATLVEEKPTEHDWTWDYYDKFITGLEVTKYSELNLPYFKYASKTKLERYK